MDAVTDSEAVDTVTESTDTAEPEHVRRQRSGPAARLDRSDTETNTAMIDDERTQDSGPASTTAHPDRDAGLRAELRIRDSIQPGARESVADIRNRIEELARQNVLDSVETAVWGRRISLDPDHEVSGGMVEDVQRFRAWAIQTDADLAPAFRIHETSTIGDDTSETVVTVPLVCLALYRGDDVVAVYPHSCGGDAVTIQQGLERLESQAFEVTPTGHPG